MKKFVQKIRFLLRQCFSFLLIVHNSIMVSNVYHKSFVLQIPIFGRRHIRFEFDFKYIFSSRDHSQGVTCAFFMKIKMSNLFERGDQQTYSNDEEVSIFYLFPLILLSANPTKWSNTLKQFIGNSRRIDWVCLTISWGWHLNGYVKDFYFLSNRIPFITFRHFFQPSPIPPSIPDLCVTQLLFIER